MPKVVAIVQARVGSTRLPAKVLKEINGVSLLEMGLRRLKHAKKLSSIVLATTFETGVEKLMAIAARLNVSVFQGDLEDVLSRYFGAAEMAKADVVVRITSDCPLIDAQIVDKAVDEFFVSGVDYASNTLRRTYPRGLDVEVFSFSALAKAQKEATEKTEREHVTPYIYRRPEIFQLHDVLGKPDRSSQRWTVDTPEDFQLIENIVQDLGAAWEEASMSDILKILERRPEWLKLNAHIEQKAH